MAAHYEHAKPSLSATSARILLLDSSWLRRQLSIKTLRRAGADVAPAANPDQARQLLSGARLDVALLSWDAPECCASDVLAHIQTQAPWVYSVAVGSALDDEQLERQLARGLDDFIQRPLTTDRIRAVLKASTEARRVGVTLEERTPQSDDCYSADLHTQLLAYLREETDALFATLSPDHFERNRLRRGMHRMRSGLLLVGYRGLAEECLDLERDCEQLIADDTLLAHRGWRIVRQIRALVEREAPTLTHSHTRNE